jgi:capsular polysaccharide biosynthesis protein
LFPDPWRPGRRHRRGYTAWVQRRCISYACGCEYTTPVAGIQAAEQRSSIAAEAVEKEARVDFWDLSKLLVRRWWAALPMLGLTFALMGLAYTTVKPNYTTTAYAVLVPPTSTVDKQGELTQVQRNVWLMQGLLALANAASVTVQDPSVPEEMQAAGFSPSFTIAQNSASAVVTFTITAKSAEQANGTASELVRRYSESVKALQDQARVAPSDQITTQRLGSAVGAVESSGNVKRALAAVGGAGLMLTAGTTIGLDALLRRRARRRLEQDDLLDVASVPDAAPLSAPLPARPVPAGPKVSRSVLHAVSPDHADNSHVPTTRVSINGQAEPKDAIRSAEVTATLIPAVPSIAPVSPIVASLPPAVNVPNAATVEPDPERLTRPPDREPDTTIVLPLTFGSGRSGDGRRT